MLFNSIEYLFVFLPLVLLVFVFLVRKGATELQIAWLIIASVVFYGSWNAAFVLLILASIIVNFLVGRVMANAGTSATRPWLTLGVCFNLALLGYFKYAGFFVDNLNALGNWLIPLPSITLPLAISFFTFQQIAYLVDVSRKQCREYRFRHYALFVLFFPQLIAGPIVHHREMMPQFEKLGTRTSFRTDLAVGLTFITIGLFKKVVMADSLGLYADPVFDAARDGTPISFIDSWIATFAFSFQIYFDFSGYSDLAIGSARLFGIRLPENFHSPYKSTSIIEFWRRWHMTLSRFLREYLYISLGGNRHGKWRRYRNLMVTMLLGGLWHGAAWTYVLWGALHGAYLCINHAWRALSRTLDIQAVFDRSRFQAAGILLTFLAVSLAFTVFRAADFASAVQIIGSGFTAITLDTQGVLGTTIHESTLGYMFSAFGFHPRDYFSVYFLLACAASICWFLPSTQQFVFQFQPVLTRIYPSVYQPAFLRWRGSLAQAAILGFMLGFSLLSFSSVKEFIYFQF